MEEANKKAQKDQNETLVQHFNNYLAELQGKLETFAFVKQSECYTKPSIDIKVGGDYWQSRIKAGELSYDSDKIIKAYKAKKDRGTQEEMLRWLVEKSEIPADVKLDIIEHEIDCATKARNQQEIFNTLAEDYQTQKAYLKNKSEQNIMSQLLEWLKEKLEDLKGSDASLMRQAINICQSLFYK